MPSGASGHDTFTQSPTSRVTSSTLPFGAWPTTGLAMVGALRTSARAAVMVSTVDCAAATGATQTMMARASTCRIIDDLLELSNGDCREEVKRRATGTPKSGLIRGPGTRVIASLGNSGRGV